MLRSALVVAVVALVALVGTGWAATSAGAQAPLDEVAAALRRDPVYVDPAAERALTAAEADALREQVRDAGTAVFVAVLPGSLAPTADAASTLPSELAQATGLGGTYAVVVGNSFRAASSEVRGVGSIATAAFQAERDAGTAAVLARFVDDLGAAGTGGAGAGGGADTRGTAGDERTDGSSSWVPWAVVGGGGLGLLLWSRRRRNRIAAEDRAELEADRQLLRAHLSVLADDILRLEPEVTIHPDARSDYDAAVHRFKAAEAALDAADEAVDLVRVERVMEEATYAMARAAAIVRGEEPPPPPATLRQPGRHHEPPLDLDERGQPVYVGGGPFYGGGWFGGGGGLFGGLLLGSILSPWGWGGFGGWGGGNVIVHDDDGGGWGGGFGGGDWGGGGDFGGGGWGDVGGGDW